MLFGSKSDAVLYVENCLINPQKGSDVWSDSEYFLNALSQNTNKEVEEWLGDFLATSIQRKVIADFIWNKFSNKTNSKKNRDLNKVLKKLHEKCNERISMVRLAQLEKSLNLQNIGLVASKVIIRILDLKDPNTVHETEYAMHSSYRILRLETLQEVPDSWIEKVVYFEIEKALGIKLSFS